MMWMMSQIAKQNEMDYHDVPDSRYIAQPVNNFLFPREEEMGSAENPITIE